MCRNDMRKGEIALIPFPFTDLTGQKVRPALILYAGRGEDCIVAFISSRPRVRVHGHDVAVAASKKNGLKFDSVIRLEKVATLQRKIVVGRLGILEADILKTVDTKLKYLFRI